MQIMEQQQLQEIKEREKEHIIRQIAMNTGTHASVVRASPSVNFQTPQAGDTPNPAGPQVFNIANEDFDQEVRDAQEAGQVTVDLHEEHERVRQEENMMMHRSALQTTHQARPHHDIAAQLMAVRNRQRTHASAGIVASASPASSSPFRLTPELERLMQSSPLVRPLAIADQSPQRQYGQVPPMPITSSSGVHVPVPSSPITVASSPAITVKSSPGASSSSRAKSTPPTENTPRPAGRPRKPPTPPEEDRPPRPRGRPPGSKNK